MSEMKLLTTTQAANKIGMKPRTFRWHIERGHIATITVGSDNPRGGDHFVEPDELERFRLASKDGPGPKTRKKKA